ncbi:MAG: Putative oxidoreductase, partial [uncultured Acidimicrobiales bacterium]
GPPRPLRLRAADHDPLGAQAARPRPTRGAGRGAGMPGRGAAGADRQQQPGLAVGVRHGSCEEAGDRRHLRQALRPLRGRDRRHLPGGRHEGRPCRGGEELGHLPARALPRGARADDPVPRRPGRRRAGPGAGRLLGIAPPRRMEHDARPPGPGPRLGMDDAAPRQRAGGGRPPRHPLRALHPGRAVPDRLHEGDRLQARPPAGGRRARPLGRLV